MTAENEVAAKELRAGFLTELESQMHAMTHQLEQLIEMHDRYGDTMAKTYLYRAKGALRDGINWLEWARMSRRGSTP